MACKRIVIDQCSITLKIGGDWNFSDEFILNVHHLNHIYKIEATTETVDGVKYIVFDLSELEDGLLVAGMCYKCTVSINGVEEAILIEDSPYEFIILDVMQTSEPITII